ncbi:hypothetical protein BC826DRAFT_1105056 [Russula brevipes]|nr:hypothetical protein BC826DRAFT_1105056 [Russula brevipes]
MTSVLQIPRFHSYAPRSPTGGGILLNPSPYTQPPSLPQSSYPSRSNQSLSPSTSSSEDVNTPSSSVRATPPTSLSNSLFLPYTSDEDHVLRSRRSSAPEYGASGSRRIRIRFAPLPDPRRSVLVTEHGEELPLPSVFDDDDPSGTPGPSLRNFPTSHPPSLLLGDSILTSKELTTTVTPDPSSSRVQSVRHSVSVSSPSSPSYPRATESPTPSTATVTNASSIGLAKRWLNPFRQKSGDSRRPNSRDSSSSRDDTPSRSLPLALSTSSDDGSRSTSKGGAPLFRARSAQPKPKRMLNGRVYGARKHHTQPTDAFQNIPDEEPKFVEWGHGGMGSVSAGGMWGKVQSSQKLLIGHTEERGRPGAPQADDDDGSGMGWVKKRREERERKKREEQAAQEAANNGNADPLPTPVSPPVPVPATAHDSLVSIDHDISMVMPAQPSPEDDESSDEDDEEVDDESSSSGTDQEDDGANQEHFKQVLGAGVERISRHRD